MPLKPVIRLVKGAYDEPKGVAFEKKSDTDRAYFALASHDAGRSAHGWLLLPSSARTILR